MAEQMDELLRLAQSVSSRLAGGTLTPACAKLYSQHTRLDAGQPGLRHWTERDAEARLNEAVQLIEVGLLLRDDGGGRWTDAILRAAEVLEWLDHPSLNPAGLPIALMSAAAYQLAGYPARAAGLLKAESGSPGREGPLYALLQGDFPRLLRILALYWSQNPRSATDGAEERWSDLETSTPHVLKIVENEIASALGVLCASLRWGDRDRTEAALQKIGAVARFMLNGRDPYSWLLARLIANAANTFVHTSLRSKLAWLSAQVDGDGELAVERYLRQAYKSCKTQAWPSQQQGIDKLADGQSFVLCTPTGSGKTTVAEIAILQSLFLLREDASSATMAPLAMYLVPKRALAAEVEAKLARTIAPLSKKRIVITGLYGGIDWGPTDAWLTSEEKTVLICTYEKGEALIRFLGPLFLGRLVLVILDEAHMVQFDGNAVDLRRAESRPLRLESLVARLLSFIPTGQSRIIALSAVAVGFEAALAKWITSDDHATPATTHYRSTRQLIGRLLCKVDGSFDIRYDLLDRTSLRFTETGEGETPFVPEPFPPCPPAPAFEKLGPEKRLRPYLFWAAMHIVAPAQSPRRHAVLVSIPQQIGGYAEDLLSLIERDWADQDIPQVFEPPVDVGQRNKWERCLLACEDYFGQTSREYRLLQKGIVAHHGKMPGLMAKLLIQLIDEGVIHLILATSTLSEGVNLPFEVVLLPTLRRGEKFISAAEFANLAGRAGRPGYGTEGKCLVLLQAKPMDWSSRQAQTEYESMIERLRVKPGPQSNSSSAESALATLLWGIWTQWKEIARSADESTFIAWLETAATIVPEKPMDRSDAAPLIDGLDSLDSILLASIVEIELIAGATINQTLLEGKLADIWRRCYAHYASRQEAKLGMWFKRRGHALATRIYPDVNQRRRLYRSGLPPRLGNLLVGLYPQVSRYLDAGADYADRDSDGRFEFIAGLVELLGAHPKFAIATKVPKGSTWQDILRWWLDPDGPVARPGAKKVSDWYDYVSANYSYRFAWGMGCILALAADANSDELEPTTLDTWDKLGLPWIALWLKDLIVWGTLDPVTAYLLGRGLAGTRVDAAPLSSQYFATQLMVDPNEQLNPRRMRTWADKLPKPPLPPIRLKAGSSVKAKLERVFPKKAKRRWRVVPVERGDTIEWVDPAGFILASCRRPSNWLAEYVDDGDFFLEVDSARIVYSPYL